jgi:hypothetical protein
MIHLSRMIGEEPPQFERLRADSRNPHPGPVNRRGIHPQRQLAITATAKWQ